MSSRRRIDNNSSSDDSPPRPSSQRETPKTAPKTAPRSAVKATPVATPTTNSKMYASGYKEKVDYSNSKEVHKCLEDLDNVISKRKMELSSIQRSSAISGGHRRKLARTTESPMKTVRNLDKDLSLAAEKEVEGTLDNNDKENTQQPTEPTTDVNDATDVPTESKEDKGNDADHSDHESISSISSKGSGAVSMDITGPIALPTVVNINNGSPSQLEPSPALSTSPVQNFVEEREVAVHVATLNESFEGDTSHQADTQDSSPNVSAFQTIPESLESPPKFTFGVAGRMVAPSNIESISLPSSSVNNSSFASEVVLSDDDAALPSNTVVPMDSTGHTPKQYIATTTSSSSTSSPASNGSSSDEEEAEEEEGADGDDIIDESDLPDNSRVVHPETYTVDNVHDQMDVEHCTVQFGHTRYDNVHLRIDSVADLGVTSATKKAPEAGLLQLENGADDNFGIAMVDVVEVDTSEKEDDASPHGGVLNESTVSVDSATSRTSRSSRGSATKRSGSGSGSGVEEEFLLGKSNESSPTQITAASATAVVTPLTTVKSVSSSNSHHKPPSGGKASSMSSSSSSSSRKKLHFSGSKTEHDPVDLTADGYDGEQETGDVDVSQLPPSTNVSGVDLDLSVLSGTSPNTSALSRKASFLECEAKLLKRHLSVYQVKNALLKEEVLQITAMSEQKFQEVLQHMQRVEEERDRAKKERTAAQEELVAEQEELLFVRGQLQSKSARLVDLEAELLASQRLLGALQKEVKIWRSQPPTPNSNTPTNAANAANNDNKSSGKRVHFRFSPPTNGGVPGEELAAMDPFQAILFLLDQLEPSHPHEKDRLQTFLRNSQRERISLESQVSDLDNKLQSSEAQGQVWKGKADDLDRAELEVGRMALEMETIQEQLLVACQERDQLLSDVQQLREALDAKEQALQELEAKHQLFVQDYQQMQHILTDMQHAMMTKDTELVAVKDAAQVALQSLHEEHQQQLKNQQAQVVLVAKESDLATVHKDGKQTIVAAAPQLRHLYAKPSVYIVKSTGFTCTLFAVLVLQLVILALLLLYLQVNFQMIMLTDNEDIIERLLRFRSTY